MQSSFQSQCNLNQSPNKNAYRVAKGHKESNSVEGKNKAEGGTKPTHFKLHYKAEGTV